MYEIIHNYRHNAVLRSSFNALAEAVFGLNFENWYQNGFWGDCYDPYSIVLDGRVVANVSLNRTDMVMGGVKKRLYQLGTVMTAPEYRNRGLIRAIMAQIEADTRDADGVYLFGNDSVLDFYPKFGFRQEQEFCFFRDVSTAGEGTMQSVPMDGPENWSRLSRAMEGNRFASDCRMAGNPGLIFFYVSQFMQDCVWYSPALNAWAIAENEDGNLLLHNVFSADPVSLDAVIAAFGAEIKSVTLGFTPENWTSFQCRAHKEEDCTFFVRGEAFADFEERKLRIPTLSHA